MTEIQKERYKEEKDRLVKKYDSSFLSREQTAKELKMSDSTLDRLKKKGYGSLYSKDKGAKNSSVLPYLRRSGIYCFKKYKDNIMNINIIHSTVTRLVKKTDEEQKAILRSFVKMPLEARVKVMEESRTIFYQLKEDNKDTALQVLSYASLVLAVIRYQNTTNDIKKHTVTLDIESAMAAKTRMDIAKTTCHYMKGYKPDLDYSACVKEQYEPKVPKVNTSMNGIVLRVNESGVYGTIRRNLEEKKLMFSPYERILTYYDLFTEHKIGIIEVDEKNAEIIVSLWGSTHIKSKYDGDVKAITANIVKLLESLNIEYEYAR